MRNYYLSMSMSVLRQGITSNTNSQASLSSVSSKNSKRSKQTSLKQLSLKRISK